MSATAETLILAMAEQGVRLTRSADRLRVEAQPGVVTDELRAILSERKAELLAALSVDAIRDRLLILANAELIEPALVHALTAADLEGCTGLGDDTLTAYLRAIRDTDLRERGKRPADDTAPAHCQRCGPVWVAPEVASVAPVVADWPRVLGCPWCHVRNRRAIPRPPVQCGACRHFTRDTVNPAGGMGRCTVDRAPLQSEPMFYPHAKRQCETWSPA